MPTIETRIDSHGKKRYRARIRRAGKKTMSATFNSPKLAKEWATRREAEIFAGKHKINISAAYRSAAEAIDRYSEDVLPLKSETERYRKNQGIILAWWRRKIGHYALQEIDRSILVQCRDELAKRVSTGTVNNYLTSISQVFSTAVKEWEWLDQSPMHGLTKFKVNNSRTRFLARGDELPALLKACAKEEKKPLYLIVLLVICTGARKQEILTLHKNMVDLSTGEAVCSLTKNKQGKTLHIREPALSLLREYARYWNPRSKYVFSSAGGSLPMRIDAEFRRARSRAGIKDFRFHDLRHTHASYLAMSGATTADLKESLGHKTLEMVARYTHLTPSHTADVIDRMMKTTFEGGKDE